MRKFALILLAAFFPILSHGHTGTDSVSTGDRFAHKAIQVGTSVVATAGLTELGKAIITERRPDGSDSRAFPSRHTSWAWAGAAVIARELYWHSPWWVLGAHTAANAMAFQRVMSKNHWPGDVVAGAALGLASVELGYWLGDLLYPQFKRHLPQATNSQAPYLSMSTEILLPLNQPDHPVHWRSGLGSHLTLSLPTSESTAMQLSAILQSRSTAVNGRFYQLSNCLGVAVGGQYRWLFCRRWAGEISAEAGVMKNFNRMGGFLNPWSFTGGINAGTSCRLTPRLAVGGQLGYNVASLYAANHSLTISLLTRATF